MERQVGASGEVAGGQERTERRMTADEARETLARLYGIGSMFVRVAQLSKILGLAAPTIYSAMREGRFFLPHRMLCSIPAVRLDDLAEWYSRNEPPSPKVRRQTEERPAPLSRESREQIIARALAKAKAAKRGAGGGSASTGRVAPSSRDQEEAKTGPSQRRRARPSRSRRATRSGLGARAKKRPLSRPKRACALPRGESRRRRVRRV